MGTGLSSVDADASAAIAAVEAFIVVEGEADVVGCRRKDLRRNVSGLTWLSVEFNEVSEHKEEVDNIEFNGVSQHKEEVDKQDEESQ